MASQAIQNAARNRTFGPSPVNPQAQERQGWRILPSTENPRSGSGRQSRGWTNMGTYKANTGNRNSQGQLRFTRS